MRKLLTMALLLGASTTTLARQPMLVPSEIGVTPTLAAAIPPAPAPGITVPGAETPVVSGALTVSPQPIPEAATIEPGVIVCDANRAPVLSLYEDVKVFFPKNIAPCAVRKIVSVPDPCNHCRCVFICICVPPCACEEVVVHPRKDRVSFNYGKYSVRVTERHGGLNVAYFD